MGPIVGIATAVLFLLSGSLSMYGVYKAGAAGYALYWTYANPGANVSGLWEKDRYKAYGVVGMHADDGVEATNRCITDQKIAASIKPPIYDIYNGCTWSQAASLSNQLYSNARGQFHLCQEPGCYHSLGDAGHGCPALVTGPFSGVQPACNSNPP